MALYVAIQREEVTVTRDDVDRPRLAALYDITCRKTMLDTWECFVVLSDDSQVVCSIAAVETSGKDAVVVGRPVCRY